MENKSLWLSYDEATQNDLLAFNEGYKAFISANKTEREFVSASVELVKSHGFKDLDECFKSNTPLKPGDKVYANNRGKALDLFVIGRKPLSQGMNILGAHIDSPRLDIKQRPLYEDHDAALLKAHYYGGIKKYQWVAIPLTIKGVVATMDGSVKTINIGDDPNDPVVGISDLLIHLAGEQMKKTASEVINGEAMNVTIGSIPLKDAPKDTKEPVKANILKLLKDKYGIDEDDLISAELEVVPNGAARDYGLDRSMIMGYGHDDKVCAYTSLMALLDAGECEYTTCCCLTDKEEVGSIGATGAQSVAFENHVTMINILCGFDHHFATRRCLSASRMLSSDVSAGFDPNYPSVNDMHNTCFLGQGIVFNKYTGARGKNGSNDASAEYVAKVRKVMADNGIQYQTSELGGVDVGGGGTIAHICAEYDIEVIDAGIAVQNMHAPYEVVSKADVYDGYLAYKAFLKDMK